ncbi:MAG: hypothetical protein RL459_699 [Pseudomonadota bacterium]|jgi:cytochrome b561
MAIPWLTVLQSVPWNDVISNAPKVADGAKRLWQKVGKQASEAAPPVPEAADALATSDQQLLALQAQVVALHQSVGRLQDELLASSELITELAQQNSGLIERAQAQDRRLARVTWLALAGCAVALLSLGLWISR